MLPFTHLLYLGAALFLVGLYLVLGGARTRVGHAALGVSLSLMAVAFARYWGGAQGQVLAIVLPLLIFARGLLPPDLEPETQPLEGDAS